MSDEQQVMIHQMSNLSEHWRLRCVANENKVKHLEEVISNLRYMKAQTVHVIDAEHDAALLNEVNAILISKKLGIPGGSVPVGSSPEWFRNFINTREHDIELLERAADVFVSEHVEIPGRGVPIGAVAQWFVTYIRRLKR